MVRREGFLDARKAFALTGDRGAFDAAPVTALARAAFGDLTLGGVTLHSLGPGEGVEDLCQGRKGGGFLLDLDPPEWRSEWGGLLLFQDVDGRVQGYRPVPGALTLFSARARPLISLVTLRAPPRVALHGWWA